MCFMKKNIYYAGAIVIVVFIIALTYLVYLEGAKPGIYDEFAKCLSEKEFVMAGTDRCSFCSSQKDLFGNSFKHIIYKNCDLEKQWCNSQGIERYPTWIDSQGNKYTGLKTLEFLSDLAECEFEILE